MSNLRIAALITGGKDSTLALHRVLKKEYEVKHLVTMVPKREDSWMFHHPNIHITDLFAEAVGIPLFKFETEGIKETELVDLKRALKQLDIDGVVSGAVSSKYQKKRIDQICQELGLKHIMPLWHEEPLKVLKTILASRMKILIVGVYAYGFDESWLGREIDEATIKALVELNRKFEVSLIGEGGEYETLVLDAPFFKKKIQIFEKEKIWQGQSGHLIIKKAALIRK